MNAFEVYCQYLALKMHFTGKGYDYFKYEGKTRASPESFLKRKDKAFFSRLSKKRDPVGMIAANYMFNPKKNLWIGDITEEYHAEYERLQSSGAYIFKSDLNKFKESFIENFSLAKGQSLPYIVRLLREGEISFFTVCVFEKLLGMDEKWKDHDSYMIFEETSKKITKSVGFFKIETERYREVVKQNFSV